MPSAADIAAALGLTPHPIEGGWFRETWRSPERVPAGSVPRIGADRSVGTAIYYLLGPDTFSEMHLLPTDEVFHFYAGHPVRQLQLWPDGSVREVVIGPDVLAGQVPQLVVPGGVWQGAALEPGGEYALLGATMAPGFDYADYRTGRREELSARWPTVADRISRLTRG